MPWDSLSLPAAEVLAQKLLHHWLRTSSGIVKIDLIQADFLTTQSTPTWVVHLGVLEYPSRITILLKSSLVHVLDLSGELLPMQGGNPFSEHSG